MVEFTFALGVVGLAMTYMSFQFTSFLLALGAMMSWIAAYATVVIDPPSYMPEGAAIHVLVILVIIVASLPALLHTIQRRVQYTRDSEGDYTVTGTSGGWSLFDKLGLGRFNKSDDELIRRAQEMGRRTSRRPGYESRNLTPEERRDLYRLRVRDGVRRGLNSNERTYVMKLQKKAGGRRKVW